MTEAYFLAEVDRILDFFATQVKLNVSLNGEPCDPVFLERSKRRAVRSLLVAVSELASEQDASPQQENSANPVALD